MDRSKRSSFNFGGIELKAPSSLRRFNLNPASISSELTNKEKQMISFTGIKATVNIDKCYYSMLDISRNHIK
jgi:hypothetical protein